MTNRAVRLAAQKFLAGAFKEARRQGIVPLARTARRTRWDRREPPWPSYWACWEIAQGEHAAPLIAALRLAYPNRFGTESKFPYRDPAQFACALLRAVICDTVVQEVALSSRSSTATAAIEELDRVVSADGQRFASVWAISDVDLGGVDAETVHQVRLSAHRRTPEMVVSRLLPEALWVSERGYPWPGAKYGGVLSATGEGQQFHYDVTRALNHRIGHVLTGLRLATGTTARELVVWTGEPSLVHIEQPTAHDQAMDLADSHWRRIAKLSPGDLAGVGSLASMLERLDPLSSTKPVASVAIAVRRYSRSHRMRDWQDTVLDLATALEACLAPPKEEVGLTLRTRAAHLLAHDDAQQAETIYSDIEDLYALRSDIIHGNSKLRKDLDTQFKERGFAHVFEWDRMHALLDRWRDIVRRSIVARLLLADDRLGPPIWPLSGNEIKVDRELVRRDRRDDWRRRIERGAELYGLPTLATAAPPLVDYLRIPDA